MLAMKKSIRKIFFLIIPLLSFSVPFVFFTNCTGGGFSLLSSLTSSVSDLSSTSASKVGLAAGLRPLTVREYNASVKVLLQDSSNPATAIMPQDTFIPFDNYFEYASVSPAKIEAFEIMATDIATAFVNDDARLKSV
ncbi:MAG: DUF1587 domain-containing protein, partial [Pseudobdellovibrionaceae bacterium]